jgi:hypothetical protein
MAQYLDSDLRYLPQALQGTYTVCVTCRAVGYDLRSSGERINLRDAPEGDVIVQYNPKGSGPITPSAVARLCDNKAEAARILRRHGYSVAL